MTRWWRKLGSPPSSVAMMNNLRPLTKRAEPQSPSPHSSHSMQRVGNSRCILRICQTLANTLWPSKALFKIYLTQSLVSLWKTILRSLWRSKANVSILHLLTEQSTTWLFLLEAPILKTLRLPIQLHSLKVWQTIAGPERTRLHQTKISWRWLMAQLYRLHPMTSMMSAITQSKC